MAHQLGGGGGGRDRSCGFVPDLNLLPRGRGSGGQQPPPAADVDRISSLPEKARLRILRFLTLKAATMLGVVSRGWNRFVHEPQRTCDSIIGIHIHPAPQVPCQCPLAVHLRSDHIVPLLVNDLDGRRGRGSGPGLRLLRFILIVEDPQTRPADFDYLLDYAAGCYAEHVSIDTRRGPPGLSFNFQRASQRLLRLSLFGVGVDEVHRARSPRSELRFIQTLQVMHIHYTSLSKLDLRRILLSCPRLHTIHLRLCRILTCVDVTVASACLVSLTVEECPQVDEINASTAIGLRSFRYSGGFLRSVALPRAYFQDLYIAFTAPGFGGRLRFYNWLDALPNLSNLSVLTICSNALTIVSRLRTGPNVRPELAKFSNLQNLRELQLLMYEMKTAMLSDMYGFLSMCRCPRLRNLFVELPKVRSDSFMDAVSGLAEEPPMDGFKNLEMVKITNFKWQCNEIELVHFLFRKASSLRKVILVTPKGTNPLRDQPGNAIFRDIKLLSSEKAPANAKVVVVCENVGAKIRVFHRDVFLGY